MKKSLKTLLFSLLLGSGTLLAQSPASLAQNEARLSRQLFDDYLAKRPTIDTLKRVKALQQKLHTASHDPESANMLHYLDLCIARLESVLRQHPTSSRIEKVGDLTHQILEGSRYLAQRSQKAMTVAIR